MARKDLYHDVVKIGLQKEGWVIVKEHLDISVGRIGLFVDLEAEAVYEAEREGEKIAVEIKTFKGQSLVTNMHEALGKYEMYEVALRFVRPELTIYLAVPENVYDDFFQEILIQEVIKSKKVNLIVYNVEKETIEKWIKQ
jgi:XisH protein